MELLEEFCLFWLIVFACICFFIPYKVKVFYITAYIVIITLFIVILKSGVKKEAKKFSDISWGLIEEEKEYSFPSDLTKLKEINNYFKNWKPTKHLPQD